MANGINQKQKQHTKEKEKDEKQQKVKKEIVEANVQKVTQNIK